MCLQEVLPHYYNHSKFSSFVRQLNFYRFRKVRVRAEDEDSDDDASTGSISSCAYRFCHEYFQKDRPELLHKIQRTTNQKALNHHSMSEQIQTLQTEVEGLKAQLASLTETMESKVSMLRTSLELERQQALRNLEVSLLDRLSAHIVATQQGALGTPPTTIPRPGTASALLSTLMENPQPAVSNASVAETSASGNLRGHANSELDRFLLANGSGPRNSFNATISRSAASSAASNLLLEEVLARGPCLQNPQSVRSNALLQAQRTLGLSIGNDRAPSASLSQLAGGVNPTTPSAGNLLLENVLWQNFAKK